MQPLTAALADLLGADAVSTPSAAQLHDNTEIRGVDAHADAYVTPGSTEEVARLLAWCNEHGVPVTPRGGGTGFAGGAVPLNGGVVLSLERMTRVRALEPLRWRMCVEAGLTTAHVRRLARENGLLFPPDPGAGEQSQIGGNIATNAGGPHAFKYGVTGAWVTGLEAVLASGEVITLGGAITKDVAGYDLRSLLVGSEGTLAVITAAWLRLIPAPEAALPLVGLYADAAAGSAAIERVIGSGLAVAALEYLDAATVALAAHGFPAPLPEGGAFMVIAEADGSAAEAERLAAEVAQALQQDALALLQPRARADIEALWRWRGGVSLAVSAHLGGKFSEDIVVPSESLGAGDRRDARDRRAPRPAGLQLGPRRRRQPARDIPARTARRRGARALARRGAGAVRAGGVARRLGQRRARPRLGEERPARAPVAAGGARPPRRRQADLRPARDPQPGEEAQPLPLTHSNAMYRIAQYES